MVSANLRCSFGGTASREFRLRTLGQNRWHPRNHRIDHSDWQTEAARLIPLPNEARHAFRRDGQLGNLAAHFNDENQVSTSLRA
jgi:hypothetical protein